MSTDSAGTIAERYTVLESIGEGGMGTVYLARDTQLDRVVAVKLLRTEMTDGAAMRFQKEAKAIAKLKHGAILTALDFGVSSDGQPYLVLDYIEGETLDEVLAKNGGALELDAALDVAVRICEGLAYAHDAGVIHRDIKPSNIYLVGGQPTGEAVKILDFGLVRLKSEEQQLTAAGAIMGSPKYMSPEQARGESVDERSDIYSTGCLLFEMLTGAPPLVGETALETLALKNAEDAPLISQKLPECELPPGLDEIVARCLRRKPADRYSSIAALGADLKSSIQKDLELFAARQSEPVTATGVTPNSLSSMQKFALFGLVVSLVVIGVLAVCATLWRPETAPEPQRVIDPYSVSPLPIDTAVGCHYVNEETCNFRSVPDNKQLSDGVDEMIKYNCTDCVFEAVVGPMRADILRGLKRANLEILQISDATFDAPAREALNDLTTLQAMRFKNCSFDGPIIKYPRKLKLLNSLTFNRVKLAPADCDAIDKLPALESIDVARCTGVTPEFIRSLKKKSKLTTFCFGSEEITKAHLESLSELKQVYRLELQHLKTATLNDALKVAGQLPRMHILAINDCDLDSDTFSAITNIEKLTYLKFDHVNQIPREELVNLGKLPNLTQLEFDKVPLKEPRDILAVLSVGKLAFLRIGNAQRFPADVITHLKSMVNKLEVDEPDSIGDDRLE